jgi:hypothetical protein
VDSLLGSRVIDVTEIDERAGDEQSGLLERLAARGLLQRLVRVRRSLGDAPRRAAVVIARRVYQ